MRAAPHSAGWRLSGNELHTFLLSHTLKINGWQSGDRGQKVVVGVLDC